jgi:two-component system sensor histidine kinase ComP
MNNTSYRKHTLFLIIFIFVSLLHFWFSYITFHFPFIGVGVTKSTSNIWTITDLSTNGAGISTGLRIGDEVSKVNNLPPDQHFSIKKWGFIEQADTIDIKRNQQELTYAIFNYKDQFISHDLMPYLAELLCFGVAAFLFFKTDRTSSVQKLAAVFFVCGLTFTSLEPSIRGNTTAKFAIMNGMSYIPYLFTYFMLTFLHEKGYTPFPIKWFRYVFEVLLLFSVARLAYFMPISYYPYFDLDRSIVLAFFAGGMMINILILLVFYIKLRYQNSYVSMIVKTIWSALVVSFLPFILLSVVPDLLYGHPWLDYTNSSWFILFFPVSFLYLIFAKKLFDIEMLLRRIFFLSCLSIIPTAILGVVLVLIVHLTFMQLAIMSGAIFLGFAGILYIMENYHERLTGLLFPRKRHMLAALDQMIRNIGSIKTFTDIENHLLTDIANILEIEGSAILLMDGNGEETITYGMIDSSEIKKQIDSGRSYEDPYSVFPINKEKDFSSFLILARKKSNTAFSVEEIQWIKITLVYLSVLIENIYLIQKLSLELNELVSGVSGDKTVNDYVWLRKSIFQLQEQERKRIASDLHDTVMQDIYFVKQRLALLQQMRLDKINMEQEMSDIVEHLEIVNINVRETCFQLYPHLLMDIGFISALQTLFATEKTKVPFQILFHVENQTIMEELRIDIKYHIFRISQELITNAKKHSNAKEVSFKLYIKNDYCLFEYEDDGVGFEYLEFPDEETELQASGIGIRQIINRIYSVKGEIDISTAVGHGVNIFIKIPLKEGVRPWITK